MVLLCVYCSEGDLVLVGEGRFRNERAGCLPCFLLASFHVAAGSIARLLFLTRVLPFPVFCVDFFVFKEWSDQYVVGRAFHPYFDTRQS